LFLIIFSHLVCIVPLSQVEERRVSRAEAQEFARRHNMLSLETSAKTAAGVQQAFAELAQKVPNHVNVHIIFYICVSRFVENVLGRRLCRARLKVETDDLANKKKTLFVYMHSHQL
jgi:hypothetical protein